MPGIQTLDRRIVGADETTELWRPKPSLGNIFVVNNWLAMNRLKVWYSAQT